VQYLITRKADGTYQAAMRLPTGDGTLQAVAKGLSAAEATVKAARAASGKAAAKGTEPAQVAAKKARTVAALAKVAANPVLRDALKSGGLEAAKAAASFLPGGALALKALNLAQKFTPAKKLLSRFLKF